MYFYPKPKPGLTGSHEPHNWTHPHPLPPHSRIQWLLAEWKWANRVDVYDSNIYIEYMPGISLSQRYWQDTQLEYVIIISILLIVF